MRRQILILTLLFVCSLPLVTKRLYASDEVQYYAFLRSLWFDHDLSFENEFQHFYDNGVVHTKGFHETFLEDTTETGLRKTFGTIGAALLWSPFYAISDAIVHTRRAMGDPVEADGYSPPYIAAVAYGSAVYGWLSLVLSLLIVRRVLGPKSDRAAFAPTIAVWIGTPLFFYMYVAPPMAHACSAFAVAVFVLTWLKVRTEWSAKGCLALGALAALMAMVREQDLFIAIGPAVDWAWQLWQATSIGGGAHAGAENARATPSDVGELSRKDVTSAAASNIGGAAAAARRGGGRAGAGWPDGAGGAGQTSLLKLIWGGVLGAVAFGVAYLPQLAAYQVINGYPGPSRLVARKLNWLAPHAFGVLASPEHGLLFWTPLVVLSLAGLVWLVVRSRGDDGSDGRRVAVCLLLMVLSQVYVAGSVESWTVAGAFGQRRFVGLTALFVVGLAALMSRVFAPAAAGAVAGPVPGRVRRLLVAAVVALGVWWNLGLMAQFGAGLMDRQRLELGRNTYQTFVTIPRRLPELAYRYVFERRSFYQAPPHER
jgi:hypothetical protein